MFFKKALDFANTTWKINLDDGNSISEGPEKYETLQRDRIKSFEIIHKKKSVFKVNTDGKTLVHRLKSTGSMLVSSGQNNIKERVRITAVLKKNPNPAKNIKYSLKENNKIIQEYEIDPKESVIYYFRENRKTETKNTFGNTFPYSPLKLRKEELLHLNGQ